MNLYTQSLDPHLSCTSHYYILYIPYPTIYIYGTWQEKVSVLRVRYGYGYGLLDHGYIHTHKWLRA